MTSNYNNPFILYLQPPTRSGKAKCLGRGSLSLDKTGSAQFYSYGEEPCTVAELSHARVEWAAANGMTISGMEQCGVLRNGTEKFRYREWWLVYVRPEQKT